MKFSLAFADQSIIVKCTLWIWNENKELGATQNWGLVNMSERFTLKKGTCLALKLTQWNLWYKCSAAVPFRHDCNIGIHLAQIKCLFL